MAEAGAARRSHGLTASALPWSTPSAGHRAAGPCARAVASWPGSLGLPRPGVDPPARGRGDPGDVGRPGPPHPGGPAPPSAPLASPATEAPSPAARRSRHGALARADVARPQQGAQEQGQRLFVIEESGCYPLPSVGRTSAPVGQPPIVRAWWTRDQLSAISAWSPEGQVSCHGQDHAIKSDDVVACLEHLRREVPGAMVVIWDGAPLHRRHTSQACLAHGAAQRLQLERLPAYAPELHPGEGLWQPLTGVARRHVCGVDLPHLRGELRDAVTRVRRKPRMLTGCFPGAGLSLCMYGSVRADSGA
jgi:transposase